MIVCVFIVFLNKIVIDILNRDLGSHLRDTNRLEFQQGQRTRCVLSQRLVNFKSDFLTRFHVAAKEVTRDQLLERVWGFDKPVDTHVLEVYVGYLRQKLEAGGESRLIQTVRGAGYALRQDQA